MGFLPQSYVTWVGEPAVRSSWAESQCSLFPLSQCSGAFLFHKILFLGGGGELEIPPLAQERRVALMLLLLLLRNKPP